MVLLFTSLYITKELGYSLTQAGWVMSVYGIGSVFGAYLGGWLTDKKNFTHVMLFSLISGGCVLFFLPISHHLIFIYSIVFLHALLADIFRPANFKAIALYSNEQTRTRSLALMRMATNVGFTLGPVLGGFIAMYFGYNWLFILDGLTSLCAAVFLYFFIPKNSAQVNRGFLQNDVNVISPYKDPKYLAFIFLVMLYAIVFFQLFTAFPQFLNKIHEYTEGDIGILLGINGLIVVLVEMPLILKLEKSKRNFLWIIAGVLFLAVSFFTLMLSDGVWWLVMLFIIFISLSEILTMPFMMTYSLQKAGNKNQGQYSALYTIAYGFGHILGPSIGMTVADMFGFNVLFLGLTILSIVVAIFFWRIFNVH